MQLRWGRCVGSAFPLLALGGFSTFACDSASSPSSGTFASAEAGPHVADGAIDHAADGAPATLDGSADAGSAAATVQFDLAGDMSFARNPNGPWSYGFTTGSTLSMATFVLDTSTASAPPGLFWHPGNADAGGAYYPYIAQNTSDASAYGSSNEWAARAYQVVMEASNSGQFAVARFVSPRAGTFALQVHAEGVHFNLSTTDLEVTKNDVSLFRADIEGYGGDPSFHPVEGTMPTADFKGIVTLAVGDVLLVGLGYGVNHTNDNDTTAISVRLDQQI